jgi:heterotetrameric sarcosine oxidase gamma subunit
VSEPEIPAPEVQAVRPAGTAAPSGGTATEGSRGSPWASGEPVARSPIEPASPVVVKAGWEVSGRHASAAGVSALTLTDCTPLTKVQLRAPVDGEVAASLGVPFGRAARNPDGTLVVGSGPGEWLLLAAPGQAGALEPMLEKAAAQAPGESVTWVDLTHGRALIMLYGSPAASMLAKVCGIDLSDEVTPDGAAFRTAVAALATDVVRDDRGGTPSYLLHCERSSGQYLFDALLRAGATFGIEIDGFEPPGI